MTLADFCVLIVTTGGCCGLSCRLEDGIIDLSRMPIVARPKLRAGGYNDLGDAL